MERFFEYFKPKHYQLQFVVGADKSVMVGRADILGEALKPTIKFHAVDMTIKSARVNNGGIDFRHEDGVVYIDNLIPAEQTISFTFEVPVTDDMQGAYLSTYEHDGVKEKIVATQFESHYARECFPCIDEPEAKATFSIKITSADPEDTILSNMPAKTSVVKDGFKVVEFEETPKMSTYLVAFALGKFQAYESTSKHGIKITTYAGLHQSIDDLKYAGDFAAEILDYYDDRFKTPYPLPKMDLLALPDFEAGAMENWGLVTFREIALLANENSSLDQKLYVCTVVAHEFAHMWFGDLVTMKWWDDLWLNESFANMMEIYATDKVRPELKAWDDFYTSTVMRALRRDCVQGVQPVHVGVRSVEDIANLFDGAIVYAKGGRLLVMLMRVMGEENFFNGIADYFEKHKYGNTEANDLWESLTEYADFEVADFMNPWITQPGYPVITNNTQQRFLLNGESDGMQYPIQYIEDDLSGHYIINLSNVELVGKLEKFNELSREQKLRLLIDCRLLAESKYSDSAKLLTLVEAFVNEQDPVIWETLVSVLSTLDLFFEPGSEEKTLFRAFVKNLVARQYRRLGIIPKKGEPDDDAKLRPIIMSEMLYAADQEYMTNVGAIYNNINIAEVNPNVRAVVAATLSRANNTYALAYFDIYKETVDTVLKHDLVSAITRSRDKEVLASMLEHLKDGTIRPQDRLSFFVQLLRNHFIRSEAFDWMYENWDWLAKEEGDKTIADYPRYSAGVIRKDDLAYKYKQFFNGHINDPSLSRNIQIAYSEIDSRLELIAHEKFSVLKTLKEKMQPK